MKKQRKSTTEVNSGSMADIAFLLLIFFLVTTTISQNKGLAIRLPPKTDNTPEVDIKERNLFKVNINSNDELLVEGVVWNKPLIELQEEAKDFILNMGVDKQSSDNPIKAIISFKTNRGTSYDMYIQTLEMLKGAYYNIYANRVGMTTEEYRNLKQRDPLQYELLNKAKKDIPMNISIAEPI